MPALPAQIAPLLLTGAHAQAVKQSSIYLKSHQEQKTDIILASFQALPIYKMASFISGCAFPVFASYYCRSQHLPQLH